MIKQILINEIKDAIGHMPNEKEYKSCLDYLNEQITNKSYLAQIGLEIINWRHDTLIKCEECGKYVMPDEIYQDIDGYKLCSYDCVLDFRRNLGV